MDAKRPRIGVTYDALYLFQRHLVKWAVDRKRAAIFADTGLGKTRIFLAWLDTVLEPGQLGLVIAPVSTARHVVAEATAIGMHLHTSLKSVTLIIFMVFLELGSAQTRSWRTASNGFAGPS